MAKATVIYDPNIDLPKIVTKLANPSSDEVDNGGESGSVQQTKIVGIAAPLVSIGGYALGYDQILKFSLHCESAIPTVDITFIDQYGLIKTLSKPDFDTSLQVQILPAFDGKYKKINMTFNINSLSIHLNRISLSAVYCVNGLYDSRLKSFGKISTFDLCDKIASELQLGFVSNIRATDDVRWIYCNNCTYPDIITAEIAQGGGDHTILEWWIDWRNNLTLIDLYDRFNNKDADIKIWADSYTIPTIDQYSKEYEPTQVDAVISNAYNMKTTPLYADIMDINSGSINETDKVLIIHKYEDDYEDNYMIEDGDVKNDLFTKYTYRGELFGDHNYLAQTEMTKMYKTKVNSQTITVHLKMPQLGLMRGDQLNVMWYEYNNLTKMTMNKAEEEGEVHTNIDNLSDDSERQQDRPQLNKTLSGRYLIVGVTANFSQKPKNGSNWDYALTLSRPADQIYKYEE